MPEILDLGQKLVHVIGERERTRITASNRLRELVIPQGNRFCMIINMNNIGTIETAAEQL
jgi:hypothetical protein